MCFNLEGGKDVAVFKNDETVSAGIEPGRVGNVILPTFLTTKEPADERRRGFFMLEGVVEFGLDFNSIAIYEYINKNAECNGS